MKGKLGKFIKIAAVVGLAGFMINTLMMLGQLKGLDSKLSANSRMLGKAIAYEKAMGEKSARIKEMASEFEVIMKQMETVNKTARGIAADAEKIKGMNDSLLGVNRAIDGVIVANIDMANEMSGRMAGVVDIMTKTGSLLADIGGAAKSQLDKVARMRELAAENNAAVPALP